MLLHIYNTSLKPKDDVSYTLAEMFFIFCAPGNKVQLSLCSQATVGRQSLLSRALGLSVSALLSGQPVFC